MSGAGSGGVAVPTPVEDSERTQIADSAPDFANGDGNNEPTHVGGQSAIGIADVVAGRAPTITATSRRSLTPSPELKRSLDAGVGSGAVPLPGAPTAGADSIAAANRTTSPDGSIKSSDGGHAAEGAGAPVAGRLSAASMPTFGAPTEAPTTGGIPTPIDTDLARTVPASERMSAITSAMRSTTPPATPRVVEKRRPVAAIVVGILVGLAVAAALALKLTSGGDSAVTPAPTATATPEPAVAPTPTPANPEATAGAPAAPAPSGATPEAKPGEANPAAAQGEAPAVVGKAAEAKPSEVPGGEAKPSEAKPAEPKPAEPVPAVAETTKPGRKPRLISHKKGVTAQNKAEAALEAAAATGGADEAAGAAAEGPAGNVARVISLPTGAEVLIDGQSVGKTPFMGKDIDPASPHALTVRKDGFETYEHMVSSSDWLKGKGPGQALKVVVKLRKTKGEAESGGDKKAEKTGEPTEPGKAEAPAAGETP
jgi:hypothetical protein